MLYTIPVKATRQNDKWHKAYILPDKLLECSNSHVTTLNKTYYDKNEGNSNTYGDLQKFRRRMTKQVNCYCRANLKQRVPLVVSARVPVLCIDVPDDVVLNSFSGVACVVGEEAVGFLEAE